MQFPGEDISRHHGQGAALTRQQRDAGRRIAEQGHAALGPQSFPRIHADLAHAIEIQVVGGIQRVQDARAFPTAVSEASPQQGLLSLHVARAGVVRVVVGKRKQKHGPVAAHGEPAYLLVHFGVHHVDQFVSGPVAFDLKRRNLAAQIFLELAFRAEHQLADSRMESIGADHEIELAFRPVFERDADGSVGLLDPA